MLMPCYVWQISQLADSFLFLQFKSLAILHLDFGLDLEYPLDLLRTDSVAHVTNTVGLFFPLAFKLMKYKSALTLGGFATFPAVPPRFAPTPLPSVKAAPAHS